MAKVWSRHRTHKMDIRDEKICQLYEKNFTLKEIGEIFDLSKQRVHQIVNRQTVDNKFVNGEEEDEASDGEKLS